MSLDASDEVIKKYLAELRDEENVVVWTDFVVACRQEIIASHNGMVDDETFKTEWITRTEQLADQLDITLKREEKDNWHIIQKALASMAAADDIPQSPCSSPCSSGSSEEEEEDIRVPLTVQKRSAASWNYNSLSDKHKWKLQSGRYVEDIMQQLVPKLDYEHPVCELILDIEDPVWRDYFTDDEMNEIETHVKIEHQEFPANMEEFLKGIPNSRDINEIYNHVCKQQVDPRIDPGIYWLKNSLESAALLLITGRSPLRQKWNHHDMMRRVWDIVDRAFDFSPLSFGSYYHNCLALAGDLFYFNYRRDRQFTYLIKEKQDYDRVPTMIIEDTDRQKWCIVEMGARDDILFDEVKLCSDMCELLTGRAGHIAPDPGMIISGILCCEFNLVPLQLSIPFGRVNLLKRDRPSKFPTHQDDFLRSIIPLLRSIWVTKLDLESRADQEFDRQKARRSLKRGYGSMS